MEIIFYALLIIATILLFILIMYVLASAIVYTYTEIRSEIRKAKLALRKAWWDVEWQMKH